VNRLKDDDEGSLTMDMELMEFSGILKTSACSKACWIGAVNLLEAAAAGEYSVRRRMYCKYSSNWDGGWNDGIPGQVCYFLDKRIRDRAKSLNERWVVVFHAGNVFESRYIFRERCKDWMVDLEKYKGCCINECAWQIDSMHDRLMKILSRLKTIGMLYQRMCIAD